MTENSESVLLDTSVWVDALQGRTIKIVNKTQALLLRVKDKRRDQSILAQQWTQVRLSSPVKLRLTASMISSLEPVPPEEVKLTRVVSGRSAMIRTSGITDLIFVSNHLAFMFIPLMRMSRRVSLCMAGVPSACLRVSPSRMGPAV